MPRRSIALPIFVAIALAAAHALTVVIVMPTAAHASVRPIVGCPLSDTASAAMAATGRLDPRCDWLEIARAADASVIHKDCTIVGTKADDVLKGTGDTDVICGYQGDDVIKALAGGDVVYGGAGKDRIRGGPGSDELHGEAGNDRLHGGNGGDVIYGQMGNDRLFGGGWRDSLSGAYGNDTFLAGRGPDYVFDSYGFDVAKLGAGRDQFYSDRGQDIVYAGRGDDFCITVFDGRPGDVIHGGAGTEDAFDADVGDTWAGFEVGPQPCIGC